MVMGLRTGGWPPASGFSRSARRAFGSWVNHLDHAQHDVFYAFRRFSRGAISGTMGGRHCRQSCCTDARLIPPDHLQSFENDISWIKKKGGLFLFWLKERFSETRAKIGGGIGDEPSGNKKDGMTGMQCVTQKLAGPAEQEPTGRENMR